MAEALGRGGEAARWREQAERLRTAILRRLWSQADAAFYDRDPACLRFMEPVLYFKGFQAIQIGAEAVLDVATFTTEGKRRANVRHCVTRARKGMKSSKVPLRTVEIVSRLALTVCVVPRGA